MTNTQDKNLARLVSVTKDYVSADDTVTFLRLRLDAVGLRLRTMLGITRKQQAAARDEGKQTSVAVLYTPLTQRVVAIKTFSPSGFDIDYDRLRTKFPAVYADPRVVPAHGMVPYLFDVFVSENAIPARDLESQTAQWCEKIGLVERTSTLEVAEMYAVLRRHLSDAQKARVKVRNDGLRKWFTDNGQTVKAGADPVSYPFGSTGDDVLVSIHSIRNVLQPDRDTLLSRCDSSVIIDRPMIGDKRLRNSKVAPVLFEHGIGVKVDPDSGEFWPSTPQTLTKWFTGSAEQVKKAVSAAYDLSTDCVEKQERRERPQSVNWSN